jgi:hypothetical protein
MDTLETFQSLIGASIGFGGVILTLWWNARKERLARETREHREMTILSHFLRRELQQIRESTEFWNLDWSRGAQGHDFHLSLAVVEVFQTYLGRLSVLPEDVLQPTVDAYLSYKDFLAQLWADSDDSFVGIEVMPGLLRVRIRPIEGEQDIGSALDTLQPAFDRLSAALGNALNALGQTDSTERGQVAQQTPANKST